MISPGQMVRHLLRDRGWTQSDLAVILDRPAQWVSEVCCDKKSITPRAALALEAASDGIYDATGWLSAQSRWQLSRLDDNRAALDAIHARAVAHETRCTCPAAPANCPACNLDDIAKWCEKCRDAVTGLDDEALS